MPCGAVEDAAAFELRGNAKDRKNDLGKIGRGIEEWLGQRADTGPGALHVARDYQQIGRVARKPINGGGDNNIAGGEGLHQLGKLRPVGRGAGDLLAEYLSAPGRLQLLHLAALVLGGRRDARVAVNHGFILHQKSASEKPNLFKAPISMHIS